MTQDAQNDVDAIASTRRRKYGNKTMLVDNVLFHSQKEAARYAELKLLVAAGTIIGLELQPVFELQSKFTDAWGKTWQPIRYVGDFSYMEGGTLVVEDTKGFITKDFRLKEKLFRFKFRSIDLRLL